MTIGGDEKIEAPSSPITRGVNDKEKGRAFARPFLAVSKDCLQLKAIEVDDVLAQHPLLLLRRQIADLAGDEGA